MIRLLTVKELQIEGQVEGQWRPIIHGIDLTLHRGEVLGLIGESGAGKSTIGLAAMGHTRPGCRIAGGSIMFDGADLATAPETKRRLVRGSRISYVAQSAAAAFNPAHRLIRQFVEGPVQHGLMRYAEAAEMAKRLYRRLDLPDPETIGERFPHQVSGGHLQRAMVAMAMACTPEIIVFDEPTTALDVTTQIEVLAAIKEIVKESAVAAIYITHDLAIMAQLAERIMVLRDGRLVEEGQAAELLSNPKAEYTRQLLAVRASREAPVSVHHQEHPLLEIRNLSAGYSKGERVLADVTFSVPHGKTVAIVGESGSGKTSLARAVTGLLEPSAGQIFFDGKELAPALKSRSRESLRRLQLIYQLPDVALNPRQKVREILGRPLDLYFGIKGAEQERRITELLEMTELPARFIERSPLELSGGEKQRVCIARGLAAKPELIICDEITSALDRLVAEEILKLLQNLQNELGVSYLFISHDLTTVEVVSDRIVVMLNGRVVEEGSTEEILNPPYHEYTELLLSSVPQMDPDWLDDLLLRRSADSGHSKLAN